MKKLISAAIILTSLSTLANSDIVLSKKISSKLRTKLDSDLNILSNYKFSGKANPDMLKTFGLNILNAQTAQNWLNERVNYVIEEKAFSIYNLLIKRTIKIARNNVDFPEQDVIPYSMDTNAFFDIENQNFDHQSSNEAKEKSFTVMANVGTALYLGGKQQKQVYELKISRGLLKKSISVAVESPRSGIIQIGEGLFAKELAINSDNEDALANSIFRLGTFFHEARHSDGHGKSLGFTHATCPANHDYKGQSACDENLNGPYTIGSMMITEMTRSCDTESCSITDKEILKSLILDNANRVLSTTTKGEKSINWDDKPESL